MNDFVQIVTKNFQFFFRWSRKINLNLKELIFGKNYIQFTSVCLGILGDFPFGPEHLADLLAEGAVFEGALAKNDPLGTFGFFGSWAPAGGLGAEAPNPRESAERPKPESKS